MNTLEYLQQQIDSLKEQNRLILEQLKKLAPNNQMLENSMPEPVKVEKAIVQEKSVEMIEAIQDNRNNKRGVDEKEIGIKWLSIIGSLALTCGIGFFIKLAIDNNLISYAGRIALGVVIGLILVMIGMLFKKRGTHEILQKVFVGSGMSLIYFVIYLMYYLEDYRQALGVSFSLAVILLIIVIGFTLYYSIKEKSQTMALVSLVFAFITSLLGDFTVFTLIYNLFVALVFLTVVFKLNWSRLYIVCLSVTYLTYFIWLLNNTETFVTAFLFLCLYFLIFTTQILTTDVKTYFSEKKDVVLDKINSVSYYLNAFLFLNIGNFLFYKFFPDLTNFFIICLAIFNFLIYYIFLKINDKSSLIRSIFFFANILLIYVIFVGPTVAMASLYLLLLILTYLVLWFLYPCSDLMKMVNIVSGLSFFKLILFDSVTLPEFQLENILTFGKVQIFLLAIIVYYAVYGVLSLAKEKAGELKLKSFYLWMPFMAMVMISALELGKYQLSAVWIIASLIMLLVGFYFKKSIFRYQGLLLVSFTTLKLLFYDFSSNSVVYRTILFIVFGIILLITSFFYSKFKDKI